VSTRDKVIEILNTATSKTYSGADDESLFDSGFLDSFGLTDVVAGLENAFGFKTPDGDLTPRKFETVEKMVAYVEDHRA